MRRKFVRLVRRLRSFALLVMLAGCGVSSDVAEKSGPPNKAAEPATISADQTATNPPPPRRRRNRPTRDNWPRCST